MTALDILERLVSFPTVSRDSNLELAHWIASYLDERGVPAALFPNEAGDKANVIAALGPACDGGVVLSGHTDVVPTDGQVWTTPPFTLTRRGERVYGRGVCDMKGFIAAVLAQIDRWQTMNLARPIHLIFSYDEEIGCLGVPGLLRSLGDDFPRPAAVIVSEPTGMEIATQHKGITLFETVVRSAEFHSSLTHKGESAIHIAAELITHLQERAGSLCADLAGHNSAFEPPYSTISVNRIAGGSALNTTAGECRFNWETRTLPDQDFTTTLRTFERYANERIAERSRSAKACAVETTVTAAVPALNHEAGDALELAAAALEHKHVSAIAVPFGTEAGHFQAKGWPTIVCGPGDIAEAHQPDESLHLSQLEACARFLNRVVEAQCVQ